MGVISTLLFIVIFVAIIGGIGYAAYIAFELWQKNKNEMAEQAKLTEKQQKMLDDYKGRISVIDSGLSDNKRRVLEEMKSRKKINQRIDENEERIKRHMSATRLQNEADAVRIRTQSIRLHNPDTKENPEDEDDHSGTVRLGNAAFHESPVDSDDDRKGADKALHVTDGKVEDYVPVVAGRFWAADGVIRLGSQDARISLGKDDKDLVRVQKKLFAPFISTDALEVVSDQGPVIFPGGTSEYNPEGWKTYFGGAGENKQNFIRGDTELTGELTTKGKMRTESGLHVKGESLDVDGMTRLRGAPKRFAKEIDNSGQPDQVAQTRFPDANGINFLQGDTFNNGMLSAEDGIMTKGRLAVHDDEFDNIVGIETGFDGGSRSALSFNGTSGGSDDQILNTDKARWRLMADQGSGRDSLKIDHTLDADHPDNDGSGKRSWIPVTIEDGSIKLHGELQVCDRNGENCRSL